MKKKIHDSRKEAISKCEIIENTEIGYFIIIKSLFVLFIVETSLLCENVKQLTGT